MDGRSEFQLLSPAFANGEPLPRVHTGEGRDVSPELYWKGIPEGTRELVLICEDPDAPGPFPWVHWIVYGIHPELGGLPEGLPASLQVTHMAVRQGRNSWGRIGFGGPFPPVGHGWHRYLFTLYALREPLGITAGATREKMTEAMNGRVLAQTRLMGRYRRAASVRHTG